MPKKKTKKFIDKKNSVTFHLVHRSQKDPLAADETAPQRVLIPVGDVQASKREKKNNTEDIQKRKEEQQKYGIFFDDDYDYLQHLRDVNTLSTEWQKVDNPNQDRKESAKEKAKIILPSSVFESHVEEKIGLLNKAAPVSGLRLDLDPEIVAALDDDFDFEDPENQLEDNFMELANAEASEEDEYAGDSEESSGEFQCSEDEEEEREMRDEICSLRSPQHSFKDEETKSRFTQYSMSSSVIRRNAQLSLLDDKFEKMYADYSDNEIGALDCEEIEGDVNIDSDMLLQCADEFEQMKSEKTENVRKLMEEKMKIFDREYSSSDEEDLVVKPRDPAEKWDCETFLSTYSNIYNHPKLITEKKGPGKIKVDPRTGIPKDILNGRNEHRLTAQNLARLDFENTKNKTNRPMSVAETMKSALSVLSLRPKDETPEQRKERKKKLKEYRKERILERKANTNAFKEEKKRQEKILLNQKQNLHGNRLL